VPGKGSYGATKNTATAQHVLTDYANHTGLGDSGFELVTGYCYGWSSVPTVKATIFFFYFHYSSL